MAFPRFDSMRRSTQSTSVPDRFHVSAYPCGIRHTQGAVCKLIANCDELRQACGFDIANCDIKTRPRRASDASLRLYRARRTSSCKCSSQPARRSDEYDVRGRRWMDCIVRLGNRRAIGRARVNVFVIRAFVKMRETLLGTRELAKKLALLEKKLTGRLDVHEAAIVKVLQDLMQILNPPRPPPEPPRRRIGFHQP